MNDTTLSEIYELSGVEPWVFEMQSKWSYVHRKDKAAMREAAFVWGRNTKALAFVWDTWNVDVGRGMTRHEWQSLLLIATLNKFERPLLYEQWRDTTMSYEQVRDAVAQRKGRKSKAAKAPTLADKLQAFICELEKESVCGAGLEVVCARRAIADQLKGLLN